MHQWLWMPSIRTHLKFILYYVVDEYSDHIMKVRIRLFIHGLILSRYSAVFYPQFRVLYKYV